jgi:magnesium transporter
MLTLYHSRAAPGERPRELAQASLPTDVAWIDLLRPEPDEIAYVERLTGLKVPGIADLSEIENSSRLRIRNGAIYLSAPLIHPADAEQPSTTPVGFVLTSERLVTVRFEELTPFSNFVNRNLAHESDPLRSGGVFAGIADAIIDQLADILENIATELEALSRRLFRSPAAGSARPRAPTLRTADLRIILRGIGNAGDLASKVRDSLHDLGPHRALCHDPRRRMAASGGQAEA